MTHRSLLCLAPLLFAVNAAAQTKADATETALVAAVDSGTAADQVLLEKIVDINSGTLNLPGVVAVKDVIEPQFQELGFRTRWVPMQALTARAGDFVAEHPCAAGVGKCGKRMLLIGHMDTVFEPTSDFQQYKLVEGTNGRMATGPGAADMKGGLVIMLRALRAMQAAGVLEQAAITVVLSGDEEKSGLPHSISRRDLVEAAKRSDVALEFENSTRVGGVDGQDSVRIGRRSAIEWKLETSGTSGHSSLVFGDALGDGAIYELARILDHFRTELREPGLTYNVGMVIGGATAVLDAGASSGTMTGKTNVVPPVAIARGDLRTLNDEQTARVEAKMRAIVRDHLHKTGAVIEFADGYPAMGVTPQSEALLAQLQDVNATLGFPAEAVTDPAGAGAGDIAFAAPYVPGLVGVGALGTGAHAAGEVVYLDSLPRQAKRMAVLMYRLTRE